MVEDHVTPAELEAFHEAGVRGIRLDLFKRADQPIDEIKAHIAAMARKVDALGWHLQFYAPGYVVRDLIDFLRGVETPFVIDHMGYMLSSDGLTAADSSGCALVMTEGQCTLKFKPPWI